IAPQTAPLCGNAVVEEGEQCDDGNSESGDGCGPTCKEEEQQVLPEQHGSTQSGSLVSTGVTMDADSSVSSEDMRIEEGEDEEEQDLRVPDISMPEIPEDILRPQLALSCGNGIIEPPEEC